MTNTGQAGFTLIELLGAVLFFVASIAAVGTLLTTTVRANDFSRTATTATNLARDKVEEFRIASYSDVTSGSDSQGAFNRSWTVRNDTPVAGTKEITVAVTWTDRLLRRVELRTIVAE